MFAITLVTDLKGLRLARYAIASLILSQDSDFRIHLHTDGFDLAEDDPIRWLASSRDRVLEGHRLSSHEFADMRTAAHISPAQFLKFAAIRPLIGQYDRVLYIDTDLLFFRSVPFETFAMGGHPVAAVHDVAEISGITSDTFQKRSAANG
ncbi:MAG: glycosyltransferase, partial [Pseudomonadota bacterium]